MLRTIGAFFVAPFPVALVQSVVVGLWPKTGEGTFENPASMFVAVCLYFYIVGLLLGLPAWLVIRRRSANLRTYMLLGLVIALVPVGAGLIAMAGSGQGSAYIIVYNLMLFGIGGMAAAALFWLIAVRKKPRADLKGTLG